MIDTDNKPCARRCIRAGTESDLLPARHGEHCERCFRSTRKAIQLAPELTEHLRAQCPPTMSRVLQEVYIAPSDAESDEPFNTAAFDAVNHLFRMVVYNARRMALLLGRKAPMTAVNAWRDTNGVVLGLPDRATPAGARYLVLPMSDWLSNNLDAIFDLDRAVVDEMLGMRDHLFKLANQWARENRARYSDMPHDFVATLALVDTPKTQTDPLVVWTVRPLGGCGGRIALHPPRFEGDPEVIQCEKCGTGFDRLEYEAAFTQYLTAKRGERNAADRERRARNRKADRPDQVRQHLIDKYVTPTKSSKETAS